VNQGDAKIDGVEINTNVSVTDQLRLDVTGSYTNFAYKNTLANFYNGQIAPRYKGSVAVSYTQPVSFGDWSARVGLNYQDPYASSPYKVVSAQIPNSITNSRGLLDARLAFNFEQWGTTVALFGTNLTNKFYYVNKVFGAVPTNITEGQPGAPREWFVTVKRNF